MKISKIIVTFALTLSIFASTAFAAPITSFSDVPPEHWAYTSTMKSLDLGLFSGTTSPIDGVAKFDPENDMTRAMFLVVVSRALELPAEEVAGANWADGCINSLIDHKVIKSDDFSDDYYNKAMTREEMAYVLANALEYTGETLNKNIKNTRIPDYYSINYNYKDEVLTAYSNGLLTGIDSNGTFNPKGTLNRAQAATVLIRLVDKDSRKLPMSDADYFKTDVIIPGEKHNNAAKEGDKVQKADGTIVTLQKGPNGILGEGQGVAPDLGLLNYSGTTLKSGYRYSAIDTSQVDSFGNLLNGQTYKVNPITGCGHWGMELEHINTKPTTNGTKRYELSSDKNWVWDDTVSIWVFCFNVEGDSIVAQIKAVNGL